MSDPLVGAWRATVTIPGEEPFLNLTTFVAGGIVFNTFPTPTPAPAGANHKLEFFTTAMGSWESVSNDQVALRFESLGVDENGGPIGSHVVTTTIDVTDSGWSGQFTLAVLDTSGARVASVSGSVSGVRIPTR